MNSATSARRMAADVVVIGGGMAGLCAAVSALERGLDVLILEKGTRPGGSMALSNGLIWTIAEVADVRRHMPDGDEALQDFVVENYPDALAWLAGLGVAMEPEIVFAGYGRGRRAAGAQMTTALMARVASLRGRVVLGTAMQELRVADGRVTGVAAMDDAGAIEVAAGAVILATGGFQGNPVLLARYVTPNADRMYLRSNPWSTGDGFLAATAAGAATTTSLDTFYGHAVTAPPVRFNAFEFQAMSHKYGQYAVALNLDGHRFADESAGTGEELLNHHLAAQPRATGIYVIDEVIGRLQYDGGPLPRVAIERARQAGGPVVQAATLEELAQKIEAWGPSAAATLQTLEEYNAAIVGGEARSLFPARKRNRLPIATAPFSAVLVRASITFTCGGLRADLDMRVLRRASSISTLPLVTADISEMQVATIPGLFVAGCDLGGVNSRGYMGGLSHALVTGRAAGAAA